MEGAFDLALSSGASASLNVPAAVQRLTEASRESDQAIDDRPAALRAGRLFFVSTQGKPARLQ
jgi:hypothetical protein